MKISKIVYVLSLMLLGTNIAYASASAGGLAMAVVPVQQPAPIRQVMRANAAPRAPFEAGPSSCPERCKEMCEFSDCYTRNDLVKSGKNIFSCEEEVCPASGYHAASVVVCSPCILAFFVVSGVVLGAVETTAKVIEAPEAAAYVCGPAECAQKDYLRRYKGAKHSCIYSTCFAGKHNDK